MEIKFSDELSQVIEWSRDEAQRTGWHNISIDHLILSAIRKSGSEARVLLESIGVDIAGMKQWLDSSLMKEGFIPFSETDGIRLSDKAVSCLNLSLFEASRYGMAEADTRALLLAAARTPDCLTREYLASDGVDTARISAEMKPSIPHRTENDYSQPDDKMSELLERGLELFLSKSTVSGGTCS